MGTNSSTQQWVFLRLPNNAPQNHYAIQRDGTEPRQILPPHDLTIKHRVSVLGKSYGREIKIKKVLSYRRALQTHTAVLGLGSCVPHGGKHNQDV